MKQIIKFYNNLFDLEKYILKMGIYIFITLFLIGLLKNYISSFEIYIKENSKYKRINVLLVNNKNIMSIQNVEEKNNHFLILKDSSLLYKENIIWIKKIK